MKNSIIVKSLLGLGLASATVFAQDSTVVVPSVNTPVAPVVATVVPVVAPVVAAPKEAAKSELKIVPEAQFFYESRLDLKTEEDRSKVTRAFIGAKATEGKNEYKLLLDASALSAYEKTSSVSGSKDTTKASNAILRNAYAKMGGLIPYTTITVGVQPTLTEWQSTSFQGYRYLLNPVQSQAGIPSQDLGITISTQFGEYPLWVKLAATKGDGHSQLDNKDPEGKKDDRNNLWLSFHGNDKADMQWGLTSYLRPSYGEKNTKGVELENEYFAQVFLGYKNKIVKATAQYLYNANRGGDTAQAKQIQSTEALLAITMGSLPLDLVLANTFQWNDADYSGDNIATSGLQYRATANFSAAFTYVRRDFRTTNSKKVYDKKTREESIGLNTIFKF